MIKRYHRFAVLIAFASLGNAQSSPHVVTADPVEISERRWTEPGVAASRIDLRGTSGTEASPAGIAAEAANFAVGTSGGRSFTDTFALRGLSNTPLFGDPAVSVYLDDLPLSSSFTYPSELAGFDSVELLRGPGQATRVGRAGTTGVLRYSTPTLRDGEQNELFASIGNYSARAAELRTSARDGTTDVYAVAAYDARKGYITNTRLARPIDGREAESALVRVRSGSVETGAWSLLVAGQRVRDGVQPLVPLGGPLYRVSRSAEGITHLASLGASLRGSFATPFGTVSTTTSYFDWDMDPATNVLAFGFAELQNTSALRQRTWSEELAWNSRANAPAQATAGIFATSGKTDGAFTRAFSGSVFEQSRYRTRHRSLAAFGEIAWKLSPSLTVTPGVRLEENHKTMDRFEQVPTANRYQRGHYSSAVLPKLQLRYDLDARTQFTSELATSYKPGGFSAFTGNRALAPFGPERLHGLDVAATRRASDDRLAFTLRGFAYRVRGYQVERSFQTGSFADDYLVVNAGYARSIGGEAELTWTVAKGLTASGSVGITHVTLRDFRDPYTGVSYAGKRAPYAPSYDAHLAINYRHGSGWFARGEITAVGRTYYTEAEAARFSQGAYALVGGRVGYQAGNYRVALYGENLGDRGYYSSITPGTGHGTPGAPRTYGVEVGARF